MSWEGPGGDDDNDDEHGGRDGDGDDDDNCGEVESTIDLADERNNVDK